MKSVSEYPMEGKSGPNVKSRLTDSGTEAPLGFQAQEPFSVEVTGHFSDKAASNLFQGAILIKHMDHAESRSPTIISHLHMDSSKQCQWKHEKSPVFAKSVMTVALVDPGDPCHQLSATKSPWLHQDAEAGGAWRLLSPDSHLTLEETELQKWELT